MSNPIKPTIKTEWFAIVFIILAFLSAVYFYQRFPEQVPTHWNFQGEVNGYSSPLIAAFMIPLIMVVLYLVFLFIPYLDPKKDQYTSFAMIYHKFKDLILVFLFIIYLLVGINSTGQPINIGFWMPIIVGILFVSIGGLLEKVKMNWFLGIRTPWTLSSETVWAKTHKLSSRVLMLAGFLMALTAFVPVKIKVILFILAIALIVLALPIYSYILYAQENKNKNKTNNN